MSDPLAAVRRPSVAIGTITPSANVVVERVTTAVLADFVRCFGPRAGQPSQLVEMNWPAEPWTGGAFTAYLGDRVPQVYNTSVRVTEPSRFYVLDAEKFAGMINAWFPMAVHLLEGAFLGVRNTQRVVGQRERLLALGSLSAGLTHELNNPAAAAVRATASLRERVAGMRRKLGFIAKGPYEPATLEALIKLQERAAEQVAKAPVLTPIEASDREDAVADWLDEHGIDGGWDLAPVFVQAGMEAAWLDQVAACVDDGGGACAEGPVEGVAACDGCAACGELCVHNTPVPDLAANYSGEFPAGPPTR
jgi:hypothetical protein